MSKIEFPLRLGRGQNDREHWATRLRRVKKEKDTAGWWLLTTPGLKPKPPLVVTITRIAPAQVPLDDDNLVSSCKAVRDAVAAWLGVDDGSDLVRYEYAQARGPWGVRIEWTS